MESPSYEGILGQQCMLMTLLILSTVGGILSLIIECLYSYRLIKLLVHIIGIVVLVLGIDGIINENVRLIFPLVSLYFVGIFILLPIYFVQIIPYIIEIFTLTWGNVVIILVIIFCFAMGVYFFIVMYSIYEKLFRKKCSSTNINTIAVKV